MKLPHINIPCKDCPFRKDSLKGWLGSERAKEIAESDSFVCHKTTKGKTEDRKQCAGHMLLVGDNSSFVRLASRLRIPIDLRGRELVFNDKSEFIDHHDN